MPLSHDPEKRAKQLAQRRNAPPPERGNRRAQKHGAKARPDPQRQAQVEAQLARQLPVRGANGPSSSDAVHVSLLAITIVRIETCAAYTSKHGMFTRGGGVRPSVELEEKLITRASNLADKLGLSATSRAKLGLTVAQTQLDLATLLSEPDSDKRQELMRNAGLDVIDDDAVVVDDDHD
jgi:hypothetical protein